LRKMSIGNFKFFAFIFRIVFRMKSVQEGSGERLLLTGSCEKDSG